MSDDRHTAIMQRAQQAMAHANEVMARIDEREGSAKDAARRERRRLNAGFGRTAAKVAIAIALVWLGTIVLGLVKPIGMFGFLTALLVTAIVAAVLIARGGREAVSAPAPTTDLPNGAMVERFDSYIYRTRRALPAAAQAQIDAISAVLPSLKETLERVETLDPNAQDARRLMSIHLPGLIDRYMRVPPAFRSQQDGEGRTIDESLVDGLSAGRMALADISEKLARADMAAFETQGRFIKSRYAEDGPQPVGPEDASDRPKIDG